MAKRKSKIDWGQVKRMIVAIAFGLILAGLFYGGIWYLLARR